MTQTSQINLDTRIYSVSLIIRAINDYEQIANISYEVISDTCKIHLVFKSLSINIQKIIDEFCNYLIGLEALCQGE